MTYSYYIGCGQYAGTSGQYTNGGSTGNLNIPIYWPSGYQPTYSNSSTYSYAVTYTYKVMDLPKAKMPKMVWVNGKTVTLGIIGTDTECAYVGKHLIFAPGITESGIDKHTIILQYADGFYHYNVKYSEEKNKLAIELISITNNV
jgi:hypothetical protein